VPPRESRRCKNGKQRCHKTEKAGWYMSRMIGAPEIAVP
jgi:hypothetical protein